MGHVGKYVDWRLIPTAPFEQDKMARYTGWIICAASQAYVVCPPCEVWEKAEADTAPDRGGKGEKVGWGGHDGYRAFV